MEAQYILLFNFTANQCCINPKVFLQQLSVARVYYQRKEEEKRLYTHSFFTLKKEKRNYQ